MGDDMSDTRREDVTATDREDEHAPRVVGGPNVHGWECGCGKRSSQTWPTPFEAAYAAIVHVRNPDGPT